MAPLHGVPQLWEPLSIMLGRGIGTTSRTVCEAAAAAPSSIIKTRDTTSAASADRASDRSSMNDKTISKPSASSVVLELVLGLGLSVVMGLTVRYLVSTIAALMDMDDPNREDRPSASSVEKRLKGILAKRGEKEAQMPPMNSYELQIAQAVLDPDEIDSSFADIGGLDETKREIYSLAILPLIEPELFQGKLVQPCKGILLYGKPGTGKTLLAKALAKEAAAVFVPIQLSNILNKYLGESNKMIAATFTLARKLAPSIIFIDELDTFLKANNTETAYLDTIKSEFLTWWDGVGTSSNSQVLVLGATNKPQAIDPAILRRMPRAFAVPLPDQVGRKAILNILFKEENLTAEAREYIPTLARKTYGYSGSDLSEFAKAAAMVAVQERTAEFARKRVTGEIPKTSQKQMKLQRQTPLRAISVQDMEIALRKVLRTGEAARSYGIKATQEDAEETAREQNEMALDNASLRQLATFLRTISNLSVNDRSGALPNNPGDDEDDGDETQVPNL